MDYRLLNGKPRATLIQRFDGSAFLYGPKSKVIEFESGATLYEIQNKAESLGWVIAVEHLHKERERAILDSHPVTGRECLLSQGGQEQEAPARNLPFGLCECPSLT